MMLNTYYARLLTLTPQSAGGVDLSNNDIAPALYAALSDLQLNTPAAIELISLCAFTLPDRIPLWVFDSTESNVAELHIWSARARSFTRGTLADFRQ